MKVMRSMSEHRYLNMGYQWPDGLRGTTTVVPMHQMKKGTVFPRVVPRGRNACQWVPASQPKQGRGEFAFVCRDERGID
jgi:hypothetical protein